VDGMGETSSLLFPLMLEFFSRYRKERSLQMQQISLAYEAESVADEYLELFSGLRKEKVLLIGLDRNFCIVGDVTVSDGDFESAALDVYGVKDFVASKF